MANEPSSSSSSVPTAMNRHLYAHEDCPLPDDIRVPQKPHTAFDPRQVKPWEEGRFTAMQKLYDAKRNRGIVTHMRDTLCDRDVAVKEMPNWWVRSSHEAFIAEHPTETEMPWQDVGCTQFLNSVGFKYSCQLHGVYRGPTHTYVTTAYANGGDMFSWCQVGIPPGPAREVALAPLAVQILSGMKSLHDMNLAHRDISLENILLTTAGSQGNRSEEIRIIDFGMSSSTRMFQNAVSGKASYQAPELHTPDEYDAYLSDTFALGVTLYAMLMQDYPWLSTKPGGCKCFEYVRDHGFRSYIMKRKARGTDKKVAQLMSEPFTNLLEGMLALDPEERLTLGEKSWDRKSGRRSVWDEPWMKNAMEIVARIESPSDEDQMMGRIENRSISI